MPTYEYECRKCGKRFERFQSMMDEPLKNCPVSGCRGRVRRLVGAGAGILFKGSGFHETDYRSESYKKAAQSEKSEKSEKSESSAKSAGKDGKSEAKKAEPASASKSGASSQSG